MSNKKKKRKRKYRLVWPWKNPAYQASKANQKPKKRKKRRKLRWQFYLAIPLIMIIAVMIYLPFAITNSRLKNIGYDKEAIKAIKEYKLQDTIIETSIIQFIFLIH